MWLVASILLAIAPHGFLAALRAPCYPLAVVSPYFSVWSCSDHLADVDPQHWDGSTIKWSATVQTETPTGSKVLERLLGVEGSGQQQAARQEGINLQPTSTTYQFVLQDSSELNVTFFTPSFGHDYDLAWSTRPITHVQFLATQGPRASKGANVSFVFGADIVDPSGQAIFAEVAPGVLRGTSPNQTVFRDTKDRISWGSFYVGSKDAFVDAHGRARVALQLKSGEPQGIVLAMDDVFEMKYFGTAMAPLWQKKYNAVDMVLASMKNQLLEISEGQAYDHNLMTKLLRAGGQEYAELCALVRRQAVGGTVAVWNNVTQEEWTFIKEISSDGDVSTVDVLYPAFPFWMYEAPLFFRKLLLPILEYSVNHTGWYGVDIEYNLSWAPHHLGTWPIADLAPNQQEQMPVEESAGMLLMITGLVQARPSDGVAWLTPYWKVLSIWADFLIASLPDPGNQLCTDDFEGPSPHNANLAAKGILGLAAYSQLLQQAGNGQWQTYRTKAETLMKQWTRMVDGVPSRRQFNIPANKSWSFKYNLMFDKLLGLNLLPSTWYKKEEAGYLSKLAPYGIPLDDRHPWVINYDLIMLASSLSTPFFESIVHSVWMYANSTIDRVPLSDWHNTQTGRSQGFRARPVMGGYFSKLLFTSRESASSDKELLVI